MAACFAQPALPLAPTPTQPRVLSFPERLAEGFPLPLPDRIQLSNILVRFHQVSEGEHPAPAGACPAAPEPPACRRSAQSRFPTRAGRWRAAGCARLGSQQHSHKPEPRSSHLRGAGLASASPGQDRFVLQFLNPGPEFPTMLFIARTALQQRQPRAPTLPGRRSLAGRCL